METYDEIKANYIAELRALQPQLLQWWLDVSGLSDPNEEPPPDVALRWPRGIGGHPRVIEVFRRHFLAVDELNYRTFESYPDVELPPPDESLWGSDVQSPGVAYATPRDILIVAAEKEAPDLAKLIAGIVYVPVGLNQHDEPV